MHLLLCFETSRDNLGCGKGSVIVFKFRVFFTVKGKLLVDIHLECTMLRGSILIYTGQVGD